MVKRKVLFIGVGFHEYDNYILKCLQKRFEVWYICSSGFKNKHPYIHYFTQRMHYFFPDFNNKSISDFIERTKSEEFDVIFVIKGANLTEQHLEKLKNHHPHAKFKLYVWDEWSFMPNRDVLRSYFPEIYSFDSEDCKQYGFTLRPLFYIKEYYENNKIYDISFVGNDHSNRFNTMLNIKRACKMNGLEYRLIVTMTKSSFMRLKSNYSIEDYSDVAYRGSIPYSEYEDILKRSKTVVDIPRETQSGITIRTIEALASGTKVITTNKHIMEYDNIPKEMYFIWDNSVNESLINFIKTPVPDYHLDKYYSLENFIEEILR